MFLNIPSSDDEHADVSFFIPHPSTKGMSLELKFPMMLLKGQQISVELQIADL